MLTLLAVISGEALIQSFLILIVFGVIFWLLWWLVGYLSLPEPFDKILRVILAIAAVVVLINALLSLVGKPFIVW